MLEVRCTFCSVQRMEVPSILRQPKELPLSGVSLQVSAENSTMGTPSVVALNMDCGHAVQPVVYRTTVSHNSCCVLLLNCCCQMHNTYSHRV